MRSWCEASCIRLLGSHQACQVCEGIAFGQYCAVLGECHLAHEAVGAVDTVDAGHDLGRDAVVVEVDEIAGHTASGAWWGRIEGLQVAGDFVMIMARQGEGNRSHPNAKPETSAEGKHGEIYNNNTLLVCEQNPKLLLELVMVTTEGSYDQSEHNSALECHIKSLTLDKT